MRKNTFANLLILMLIGSTFSPWRAAAQILPILLLPAALTFPSRTGKDLTPPRWTILALISLSAFSAIYNESNPYNYGLGLVTWFGSLASLFIAYRVADRLDAQTHLKCLLLISLLQVPVGLFQMMSFIGFEPGNPFNVHASVGDYFGGTLLLGGRNSHVVAIKMAMSMILAFFTAKHIHAVKMLGRTIIIWTLALGWILPSAIHSFLCFILALATYALLQDRRRVPVGQLLAFSCLAIVVIIGTQEFAVDYARELITRSVSMSPVTPGKVVALYETVFELPSDAPAAPVIGIGLGRYSSYAALVLTGELLASNVAYLPVTYSYETAKYILALWNRWLLESNIWTLGVANQPFFTYMSIYGELGGIGLGLFLLFWLFVLRDLRRISVRDRDNLEGAVANGMLLFTIFLVYLFLFDNWFEDARLMVPYFVILGILYRKSRLAALERGDTAQESVRLGPPRPGRDGRQSPIRGVGSVALPL